MYQFRNWKRFESGILKSEAEAFLVRVPGQIFQLPETQIRNGIEIGIHFVISDHSNIGVQITMNDICRCSMNWWRDVIRGRRSGKFFRLYSGKAFSGVYLPNFKVLRLSSKRSALKNCSKMADTRAILAQKKNS